MELLTLDELSEIFYYLPWKSRIVVRFVCTKWKQAEEKYERRNPHFEELEPGSFCAYFSLAKHENLIYWAYSMGAPLKIVSYYNFITNGKVELVKWMKEKAPDFFLKNSSNHSDSALNSCCRHGNFEVYKFLIEECNHKCQQSHFDNSLASGNIKLITYIHGKDPFFSSFSSWVNACETKNTHTIFEMLNFPNNTYANPDNVFKTLVKKGNLEGLEYFHKKNISLNFIDDIYLCTLSQRSNFETLEWLESRNIPFNNSRKFTNETIEHPDDRFFIWMVGRNPKWNELSMKLILRHKIQLAPMAFFSNCPFTKKDFMSITTYFPKIVKFNNLNDYLDSIKQSK